MAEIKRRSSDTEIAELSTSMAFMKEDVKEIRDDVKILMKAYEQQQGVLAFSRIVCGVFGGIIVLVANWITRSHII